MPWISRKSVLSKLQIKIDKYRIYSEIIYFCGKILKTCSDGVDYYTDILYCC